MITGRLSIAGRYDFQAGRARVYDFGRTRVVPASGPDLRVNEAQGAPTTFLKARLLRYSINMNPLRHSMAITVQLAMIALLTCSTATAVPALTLSSAGFSAGNKIPQQYTCAGANQSPPLQWQDVPKGTRMLALIVDDPDAPGGDWVHWVLYDLPPDTSSLPAGVPPAETLPSGAKQGRNDFKAIGYKGPCPPSGSVHRYVFTLYALDAATSLTPGATIQELQQAMQGHTQAQAQLIGTFEK